MAVSIDIQDKVALITMDDGKVNAINFEVIAAINDALDKAESDAGAAVLTGRDGLFSAGFDLRAFADFGQEKILEMLDRASELLIRLYGGPLPVVGACSGHAIAMGVFLLLACDERIGADGDFKIGANETTNGMNLPVFALELARARLASHHQTRAIIHAHIYDPIEAAEAGYLDSVVASDRVIERALHAASRLAALPSEAYGYNKYNLRKATLDALKAGIGKVPA